MRFAPTYFRPVVSKHSGKVCSGVQIIVEDRQSFRPFLTALTMLEIIREFYSKEIQYRDCSAGHCVKEELSRSVFTRYIDKLLTTDAFSEGCMTAQEIADYYAPERKSFRRGRNSITYMSDGLVTEEAFFPGLMPPWLNAWQFLSFRIKAAHLGRRRRLPV
ncbi:MAG: DUF1343 domain-containing protein [Clostridia bacterium]|nr:DUF1343 domain-containing protein [Clostridia bacterium]MBQ6857891.1 DUF1343 domain-containing protein [Clostridia bacterium]